MSAEVREAPEVYEYNDDGEITEEFVATENVDVVTNRYRTLATREIEEGEALQFGKGDSARPDKAEGFAFAKVVDDTNGNQQHGSFRITKRTKSGQLVSIITELNSKNTDQTRSDLDDGEPLPVQTSNGKPYAGGGSKGHEIHLEMKASNKNGSFTWDYDNDANTVSIDGKRLFE